MLNYSEVLLSLLMISKPVPSERVTQKFATYDETQSDFENLESNRSIKIVGFSCKTTA